jgi:hypothetical protein
VTLSLTLSAKARLKDKVMVQEKVPIAEEPADALKAKTP